MLSSGLGLWPLALVFWLTTALQPVWAGVLELKNGDRIIGEFIRASEDNVHWRAQKLGNLTINKSEVLDIRTSKPLKINGVADPCLIEGMEREHLIYTCGDEPEPRRVPLVSLAMIIPYEQFIAGDSSTFSGRVNLSGTYSRGNEIRDDWRFGTNMEYRQVDWRHAGNFEYASFSRSRSEPELKWGLRYTVDWFFRERWFLNNDIRLGRDETRSVDRFYNLGSGTGYQFWENPTTALSLAGGLVYVAEEFEVPSSPGPDFVPREERIAWRLSTDFRYRLPLGIAFFHRNELVTSFEDGSDWQLSTTSGLNAMIAGMLRSELRLDYDIDNSPQQDTARVNRRLVVGLTYEW